MNPPDLTTEYLGLKLKNPLIAGASPMVDNLDLVRRLEQSGVSAIVMHSLFEEQIENDWRGVEAHMDSHEDSFAEALDFFPGKEDFALTPARYLMQIARIKSVINLPLIASLNGTTTGGWISLARAIQEAGADALELNTYFLAADPNVTCLEVEERILEILTAVRHRVTIPVCVKLSPFFSSLPNLVTQLEAAGADGVVLFNRFYQPDIDIDNLEVVPSLQLSTPEELRLRLRWLAVLEGRSLLTLAASGGVHGARDLIKAVMAGAHGVQTVSAFLKNGPEIAAAWLKELSDWMSTNEYESITQMRGCMSHRHCPDPSAYERANYVRVLQTWVAG